MKVYLCGPINGCSDEMCKSWRDAAKSMAGNAFEYIDPMRNDFRGIEGQPGVSERIVAVDKKDIIDCDILLAMSDKPSYGTAMEIMFAKQQNKVVIVVSSQGAAISPWVKVHSDFVCGTLPEAIQIMQAFL